VMPHHRNWYAEGMINTQANQIENMGGFGL
jgi:hypothetical protein